MSHYARAIVVLVALAGGVGSAAQAAIPSCPASGKGGQAHAPAGSTYLRPNGVDIVALLPPPPRAGTAAERQDLQAVLMAQRSASASEIAHAVADSQASCARFEDVLGPALSAPSDAAVIAFLNRAAHDAQGLIEPAKHYWHRARPYVLSTEVQRRGDVAASACAQPEEVRHELERAHSSYPSGHSTVGTVCAILLADMVPSERAPLFARALDFGHSRLVVGAHFPSDVAAGRLAGTVAAALMMQNAQFRHDFSQARTRLRAALHLCTGVAQPCTASRRRAGPDSDPQAAVASDPVLARAAR